MRLYNCCGCINVAQDLHSAKYHLSFCSLYVNLLLYANGAHTVNWSNHRYVRSTRCRTSYSRCIISCIATNKDPSKFRSIFSDNLQPIATRGKIARGTLLVDIGCSSERALPSVSYYNEISSGHIWRGC